ncbi:PREDICTED: olfactory receptor 52N4-like [Nanorana parkeri]|uniref:olfactory receptor 52N4-like n=1 Tax=Nanorana parkeri TaxID=125878 RepID=UPI00085456C7|nr:PREDICTED: olfactory receptor 52N4-like [Nanorana parkeri]
MPSAFLLIGIPGIENGATWTSLVFCVLYVLAILGNSALLYIIKTEESLHTPMFFFLSLLALNDLAFCSSTVPKTLGIFWMNGGLIDATSCLTQMFFVHCLSVIESGILTAMAYDRFVAICSPLRYSSVLTYSLLRKIALAILLRAIALIFPIPLLVRQLQYCGDNIVLHTYCDHMAVVNVACGDKRVDNVYGLVMSLFVTGFDLLFIGLSYSMILQAIFKMPTKDARQKAVGTCGSHISIIFIAYFSAIFSFLTYRFGQKTIPHSVHILSSNMFILFLPFWNPLVYGVKTKKIRQRVQRILFYNQSTFPPSRH